MKLLVVVFLLFQISISKAVKTNVNEVSNWFDEIEGKKQLFRQLKKDQDLDSKRMESKDAMQYIKDADKAEEGAKDLSAIKPEDLESKGRKKRSSAEYQFYDEGEFEPNYNKAGNKAHYEDAQEIAKISDDTYQSMGKDMLLKLKNVHIDCKTVKGPIKKDPVFYLESKEEV